MQSVKLNLIPGAVLPVVNVSQYDVKRTFALSVYDGAASYDLTGKTVTIRGTKPDNHGFDYGTSDGVVSVSGNTVTISTTQQMTAVGGQVMAELRIESGTTVIGTLNFIIDVEPSALSDDTIISDTEIPVIERDFEAALERAEDAATDAETAAGHYPYIDAVNKHWMVWDSENETWTDTGVVAEGTSGNYSQLTNKPQINSVTLSGNKSADDLGLATDAAMTGASADSAGTKGLVPAPAAGDQGKFLRGDGTWANGGGGASALDDLTDVDITTPASGDGLLYDGVKWVNGAVATPDQIKALEASGAVNQLNNKAITQVISQATFTVNADLSVSVAIASTPSSNILLNLDENATIKAGSYYLVGCPDIDSDDVFIQIYKAGVIDVKNKRGTAQAFTVNSDITGAVIRIVIGSGVDYSKVNGKVFEPMIYDARLGLNVPYRPYAKTNRELTENISFTPTVTISDPNKINIQIPFTAIRTANIVFVDGYIRTLQQISAGENIDLTFSGLPKGIVSGGGCSFSGTLVIPYNIWDTGARIRATTAINNNSSIRVYGYYVCAP